MIDTDELAAWLRLLLVPGIGREGARRLLAAFGSPQAVVHASEQALATVAGAQLAGVILTEPGRPGVLLVSPEGATPQGDGPGWLIGDVLAGLVNFFNPSMILVGGGVSNIGNQLLASIRQAVLRRSTALATRELTISYSPMSTEAGVTGAIHLALEHLFVIQDKTNRYL